MQLKEYIERLMLEAEASAHISVTAYHDVNSQREYLAKADAYKTVLSLISGEDRIESLENRITKIEEFLVL